MDGEEDDNDDDDDDDDDEEDEEGDVADDNLFGPKFVNISEMLD